MKYFEQLDEQQLEELLGVIDQRLASIASVEDTSQASVEDASHLSLSLYKERLSLYILQEAVAEKRALLLGQDPPPKPPLSLPQFYITAEDIYKVYGWEGYGLKKESIALIYKDLDELNQTELEGLQQVVTNKYAAIYKQSSFELGPSVDYKVALSRLKALEEAIIAKRQALTDGEHLSIKERLVSQGIVAPRGTEIVAPRGLEGTKGGGAKGGGAKGGKAKGGRAKRCLKMGYKKSSNI